MTPPADATWTPVEMRWRLVRPGDVVLDPDGRPWMTTCTNALGRGIVTVVRTAEDDGSISRQRDPDQTVRVLVPAVEAAAVVALREQLGPVRVLDRGREA